MLAFRHGRKAPGHPITEGHSGSDPRACVVKSCNQIDRGSLGEVVSDAIAKFGRVHEAAYPFSGENGIQVRPLAETWAIRTLMLCVRGRHQLSGATRLLMEHLALDHPESLPERPEERDRSVTQSCGV